MGRLFGTDGARGVANAELTCEMAMNIGRAAAMVLTNDSRMRPKILIGKDTRISSDMLENALAAGLCSVGADVVTLGVVPTPAVAFLIGKLKADAGIMISASHNPCEFNGIKIFSGDGFKLPDALEEQIEAIVLDHIDTYDCPTGGGVGSITREEDAVDLYIQHIKSTVPYALDGMKIALDCANGSASRTAERLYTELGAECYMLHDKPNGTNINDKCGSTHMESLKQFVLDNGLDAGIAFDGDADRCLLVDETGHTIDGDKVMAVCGADLRRHGKLSGNAIVATVMSNLGLHEYCRKEGIELVCTAVGDRHVLEKMLECGYAIGGEQSGHTIFREYATTGDGELTALQFLQALRRSGKRASELASCCPQYPQELINVAVSHVPGVKDAIMQDPSLRHAIAQMEQELAGKGRVLIRPSGTEALIRVMVEAKTTEVARKVAEDLADLIKILSETIQF